MIDFLQIVVTAFVSLGTGVGGFLIQRTISTKRISQKDMFSRWSRAFDRPAFKGTFTWDSSIPDFKKAVETTIGAIGSGTVSSDREAEPGLGRVYVKNKKYRSQMEQVVARLSSILLLVKRHEDYLEKIGKPYYEEPVKTKEVEAEIDNHRDRVIEELNKIWEKLGIDPLPILTKAKRYYEHW